MSNSINIKNLVFNLDTDEKPTTEITKLFDSINLNVKNEQFNINTTIDNSNTTDLEEKNITIESLLGLDSSFALQNSTLQKTRYKSFYIILDSNNRSDLSEGLRKFRWEYSYGNLPYRKGFVQTTQPIKNIVGMRIHPISLYHNTSVPLVDYNYTVLIEEFASQSVLCHEGRRYHFMLHYDTSIPYMNQLGNHFPAPSFLTNYYATMSGTQQFPLLWNLVPNDDGYFWFDKTILDINSFTITLGNPIKQIDFPFLSVDFFGSWLTPGNPTNIFHTVMPLYTGDKIIISGFSTSNPIVDQPIIDLINDPNGHVVTVLDSLNFTINVDSTGLSPTVRGALFNVINTSLNISIGLEIITM